MLDSSGRDAAPSLRQRLSPGHPTPDKTSDDSVDEDRLISPSRGRRVVGGESTVSQLVVKRGGQVKSSRAAESSRRTTQCYPVPLLRTSSLQLTLDADAPLIRSRSLELGSRCQGRREGKRGYRHNQTRFNATTSTLYVSLVSTLVALVRTTRGKVR